MRCSRHLVPTLLIPLLVACGGDDGGGRGGGGDGRAGGDRDGAGGGGGAAGTSAIEVLDAGGDERALLSIGVDTGHRESSELRIEQSVSTAGAPSAVPAFLITLVSEVVEATDEEIVVEQTYADISAETEGDPATQQQVEDTLQPLLEATITTTLARDGTVLDTDTELPDDVDPTTRGLFEQFTGQSGTVGLVLPSEEVGEGASWRSSSTISAGGYEIEQTATYTLDRLEGDEYDVAVEVEQEFVEGSVGGVELVEGGGSASGRLSGSTGTLQPASAEVESTTSLTLELDGEERTVETVSTVSTTSTVE